MLIGILLELKKTAILFDNIKFNKQLNPLHHKLNFVS